MLNYLEGVREGERREQALSLRLRLPLRLAVLLLLREGLGASSWGWRESCGRGHVRYGMGHGGIRLGSSRLGCR